LEVTGYNVIPNLRSFRVLDLFEIYRERFGLAYTLGQPRISEKLHEMMVSKEEAPRTVFNEKDNTYYMHYKDTSIQQHSWQEFTSDLVVVSKEELVNLLEANTFFKP
jgi:UDP-glucose 4-epimerase